MTFYNITNSVTDETRLKTCIEELGCEAPGVEILTNDDCYLLDEKYASSITMGNGDSTYNSLCKDRTSFIIENRPNLKSITIGEYVCSALTEEIVFRNLPNFESIEFTGANSIRSSLTPLTLTFSSIIHLYIVNELDLPKFNNFVGLVANHFFNVDKCIIESKRIH